MIVIGTSICDLVVHPEETRLPGITGVVKDGILPGPVRLRGRPGGGRRHARLVRARTLATEARQLRRARARGGARSRPGETGLVALDWWNGNRTILADADLTGAIFGLTLQSTREEIYRALLESIAFGSRRIMENFEEHGLELTEIVACGGIAERSPLMMQLLADTSGRRVHVPASSEIPARGAALFGAVAAGRVRRHRGGDRGHPARERVAPTSPTATPSAPTTACTRSTASLYEMLGRSQVRAAARAQADPHDRGEAT